jgi:hypothetical protein
MIFEDAKRRLRDGEERADVAAWLVGEGLSPQVAYEIVGVLTGSPPDVVPASVFPLSPPVRPTGQELFDAKSEAEQDEMVGAAAAEAIRSGSIELSELVAVTPLATDQPDYITQAPTP